jgi:ubiquinone/menaquinone biosynthesis C-methylase UbiE
MLGVTATEVRSSPRPMFRRWLAERLPRRARAFMAKGGVALRSSASHWSSPVQAPLLEPIIFRQWIYGSGCVIPGDAFYLEELMKPLGLEPKMTVLDLNAGMGGAGAAVAQGLKADVTGLECNPDLVQAGASFLRTQKAGRRVKLRSYDPENFVLPAGSYDCVMAREVISTLVDKEAFFQAVSLGLKIFGQIVITDFVRGDAADDSATADWAAMQERKPLLSTRENYIACLERLGCEVRIAKDATADYRDLLLRSWRRFLDHPQLRRLKGQRAGPLMNEVERCVRTLTAFDSGALRYVHICAQSTQTMASLA